MTQTETPNFVVGQVVAVDGHTGYYYRVYAVPAHGDFVTLYGGRTGRGGLVRAGFRAAAPCKIQTLVGKALDKALDTMTLIEIAQTAAPKPRRSNRR